MKKQSKESKNYLDFIPEKNGDFYWEATEDGKITIDVPNKGFFSKIAQVAFHRPKVSHIELDEFGNFVWPLIDGEQTIYDISSKVKEHFQEAAEPLYPRVVKYFQILQGHNFILMKE